jgi:hypothetical protein
MKNITKAAALLLTTSLILTNLHCKKDDNKTKTELLTAGPWYLTAHTSNPAYDWNDDGTPETDLYSVYDACEKDDAITYKADGSYETNEGAIKCDPDASQTETGFWSFTNNENKISTNQGQFTIEELTSTQLRMSTTILGRTWTVTLKH